jgi:glycosyltransferase involved in cell wall biosynthesis
MPLFQKLSEVPSIDLEVYFLSESAPNRRWSVDRSYEFRHKVLPGVTLSYHGRDLFSYIINPTTPLELVRSRCDLVVSSGWLDFACQAAFFASKAWGKPYILWAESTINEPSWRRTASLPLVKMMVRGAYACIACGTRSREYLRHLGADAEKVFTAINTVDVDHFRSGSQLTQVERAGLKRELGAEGRQVILYAGQLIERKGLRYLLEAYGVLRRELADLSQVIIGHGPQEGQLKRFCVQEGMQDVHFLGYRDPDEMPRYYGISDLFVLPSTEEAWGLVINEAMACGLPVITTDRVGASPDLIEDGVNGYVVEAANVSQLDGAMRRVLEDPGLRERLSEGSKTRIRNFGLAQSVDGFVSAIECALR